MPENKERSELENRLRRLPARFALALVNATSVLLIAAAVLMIVALSRVEHAAGRIATSMTDAVLARVQIEPARLTKSAQAAVSEIHDLRMAIKDIKDGGALRTEQLKQQIADITDALTGLRGDIKTLTEARVQLTDEAIRAIGNSFTDWLLRVRNCRQVQAQLLRNPI